MRRRVIAILAVAVAALAAAVGATAAPPMQTVSCVVGGTTSFAHPPKGTDNAVFAYYTLKAVSGTSAWAGGARRVPTPSWATTDNYVIATFFNGSKQVGQAEASCM